MLDMMSLKNFSFLIYGLGFTGRSVIKFFKKKDISNYYVWDDNKKLRKKFKSKETNNLKDTLKRVDFIVLSPGVSLEKSKYKKDLKKNKKKIITDIDLLFLSNSKFKSIVVTGTNGKSTTCQMIYHLIKKNNFKAKIGGNIGKPVLNLKVSKNTFLIIEASSFQLSHSKFIHPNYAILTNISNDHIDWHGSIKAYIQAKLKIFQLQTKKDFALIDDKFKKTFKKKNYLSKLSLVKFDNYKKIKNKINNRYLKSSINDENMKFVYSLSKLLKINDYSFINSMNSFKGLFHRYETFFKKKNIIFINDSKASSFQAAKGALINNKNIFWILGGLPKKGDKFNLKSVKNNIVKTYIIGKNVNFFKKQLKKQIKFKISKKLQFAINHALKDIRRFNLNENIILLSPCAASFDQFKNFEDRGNQFKKLSKIYAKKII